MSYDMDVNHEILRKQVMVGQFCNQVGCSQETATKILQAARWQIEVAFSLFFQDHGIVSSTNSTNTNNHNGSLSDQTHYGNTTMGQTSISSHTPYSCVPTNTPATPPSLPDTLAAFAQMKASSPDQRSMEPPPVIQVQQFGDY